jgi:hypothetical protein
MAEPRTCINEACLRVFEPNVRGATKQLCPRCYAFKRRHGGALPSLDGDAPMVQASVKFPRDLFIAIEEKAGDDGFSEWVRQACALRAGTLKAKR